MKTTRAFIAGVLLCIATANEVSAQWFDLMNDRAKSYQEITNEIDEFLMNNPGLDTVKGSGYKDYMRWKSFWSTRNVAGSSFVYGNKMMEEHIQLLNQSSSGGSSNPNVPSSNWEAWGPFNTPPGGKSRGVGRVNALYIDPLSKIPMLAGSNTGGLFYFDLASQSWKASDLGNSGAIFGISDIAVNPNNPQEVLIALGNDGNITYGFGILKSTDAGKTFTRTSLSSDPYSEWGLKVNKIKYHPLISGFIIAVTNDQFDESMVFRSLDNGETWTEQFTAPHYPGETYQNSLNDIDFHPTNPDIIIVSSKDIFKSTDGGDSFSVIPGMEDMRKSEFIQVYEPWMLDPGFNGGSNGLFLGTNNPNNGHWEQYPSPLVSDNAWIQATVNGNNVAAVIPKKNQTPPQLSNLEFLHLFDIIHLSTVTCSYRLTLDATIPKGTRLKISVKEFEKPGAVLKTFYIGEFMNVDFSGTIQEDIILSDINANTHKVIIEAESNENYNETDMLVIDNYRLQLYREPVKAIHHKVVIDKWNPDIYHIAAITVEQINEMVSGGVYLLDYDVVNDQWTSMLHVDNNKFINTKFEFEQSQVNQDIFYLGGIRFYRVNLNIPSYEEIGSGMHDDVRELHVLPDSDEDLVFVGHDGGISSISGADHLPANQLNGNHSYNQGLDITQFYGIGVSETVPGMVAGGTQDLSVLVLKDGSWRNTSEGDGGDCIIDYTNANKIYSGSNGDFTKSTDGGFNWSKSTFPKSGYECWSVMHPTNSSMLFTFHSQGSATNPAGLYRTQNSAVTWEQVSPRTGSQLAISHSSPDVMYIADASHVYKTTKATSPQNIVNQVSEWADITNGFPTLGGNIGIATLAVDPDDETIAYAGLYGFDENHRVYKTTNGGLTWLNYSSGLPKFPVNKIVVLMGDLDEEFAGTDVGVYYRNKNMSSWELFSSGLPLTIITDLEVDYTQGKLFAGTFGRGLWVTDIPCPAKSGTPLAIEGNLTWEKDMRLSQDIILYPGALLTLKASLYLPEEAKITIRPGAKLVMDGGTITTACGKMWAGIVVEGNRLYAQSPSTHGTLEMKNNAEIEHAHLAVKSLDGGMVKINKAIFRGNRQGIFFGLYGPPLFPVNTNKSHVVRAEFLCDKPMNDPVYTGNGQRLGIDYHLHIYQQSGILVLENEFDTKVRTVSEGGGTGIIIYNSRASISANTFFNLTRGIDAGGYYNVSRRNFVTSNIFTGTKYAFTESAGVGSVIKNNSFTLPLPNDFPSQVLGTWGIYSRNAGGAVVHQNEFYTLSSGSPKTAFGSVILNSGNLPVDLKWNYYESLGQAAQTEGNNPSLLINCNEYKTVSYALSLNPQQAGIIANQGSDVLDLPQAANLFLDQTEGSHHYRHIRLNEEMNMDYYYVEDRQEAQPLFYTGNVNTQPVLGSSYDSECGEPNPDPCMGNPYPCLQQILDAIQENEDERAEKQLYLELFRQMADTNDYVDIAYYIQQSGDPDLEALLLPLYIDDSLLTDAGNLLSNLPYSTEEEVDYKDFYTALKNIREDMKTLHDLDFEADDDAAIILEIAMHDTYISEAARYIARVYFKQEIMQEPEAWEEEAPGMRLAAGEEADSTLQENRQSDAQLRIIPNPLTGMGSIELRVENPEDYKIVINDVLGRTLDTYMLNQSVMRIELNSMRFENGVYFVNLIHKEGRMVRTERMLIIK